MTPPSTLFSLIVRQQPCKARLCSFKEKVDRRPIDPPPIIQLQSNHTDHDFLQNPYFFLYATLTDTSGETDLHFVHGNRTTAGTVVQSLHKLKDVDNTDGGFFIFSDISIRLEGFYRLKFTLYEIDGFFVKRMCSIVSNVFQVYSPKSFPGMSESTFLTRSFSDQGVRIRIRKEPRSSLSTSSNHKKRRKDKVSDEEEEEEEEEEVSPMSSAHHSCSPLPERKETFSPMSMQNILSNDNDSETRLFSTRKLPLPLPSQPLPPPPQHNTHHHHPHPHSWISQPPI
ncbi:hypothetical protein INT47_002188 [Mucor saturninus]|uniref:Velvet domain-containing protein n=1 Tax=Mucor saturninus TaxID=64648 RepID=A0A8H7R5S5_9FUNG|nr:hypothetical protein INT47_002188 [Mucor saturninus]